MLSFHAFLLLNWRLTCGRTASLRFLPAVILFFLQGNGSQRLKHRPGHEIHPTLPGLWLLPGAAARLSAMVYHKPFARCWRSQAVPTGGPRLDGLSVHGCANSHDHTTGGRPTYSNTGKCQIFHPANPTRPGTKERKAQALLNSVFKIGSVSEKGPP